MKGIPFKNKKTVEIFLALLFVSLTAGFYYFIYIPGRAEEIISRRFRTLQRIEENSRQKVQGYMSTIKNCAANIELKNNNSLDRNPIVDFYEIPGKFRIEIERIDSINKDMVISVFPKKSKDSEDKSDENNLDVLFKLNKTRDISSISVPKNKKDADDKNYSKSRSFKFLPDSTGKNLIIMYDTLMEHDGYKKHYRLKATISNREFIMPLLRENVFDHYIVFNNSRNIHEDFNSGFSFENIDSLFNSKDKIYSSRIVKIETGGEKYLAFLHPCGYRDKNDRIIAGLLSQKAFDKEKRKLPEGIVTTLLFIALFSLLLIPILKLALMGKKERISIGDLLFNYISMMLLISVILLLFLRYNNNFLPPGKADKDSKCVLASQISNSLNKEIESAYNLLDVMDKYYKDHYSDLRKIHFKNLKNESAEVGDFSKDTSNVVDTSHLNGLGGLAKTYKNAVRLTWIDSTNGKVLVNWSYGDDAPGLSVKDRNFFKNIAEYKTFSLGGNTAKQYSIEPVTSWNDGMFRVVIAKRSLQDSLIASVSCNFESVVNPVLPLGYSFAITDSGGDVIFHSNTVHNLNENLLKEFIDPEPLKVAFHTKTQQKFTTYYEEQQVSTLAQPIEGLPYFIIIFYNEAYNTTQNANCLGFTFTMLLSLFLFICIEMLIIFLCYYRHSKLLRNKFDFSWIHPLKSSSVKYFFVFLFNTGLFIILLFFCFHIQMKNLIDYIFFFLISSVLSSLASCWVQPSDQNITLEKANKKAIVSLIILAVIVIIASCHYSAFWIVISFTSISIVLFVILYLIFMNIPELKKYFDLKFREVWKIIKPWYLKFREVWKIKKQGYLRFRKVWKIIKQGYLKFRKAWKIKKQSDLLFSTKREIKTNRYLMNFRLMVFSKLLLTSCIPIAVFFICSYNFEEHLNARLKLFDYAENIKKQVSNGVSLDDLVNQIKNTGTFKNFYTDANWINKVYVAGNPYPARYKTIDSVCIDLLTANRVHYNDISYSTENLEIIKPFGNDSNDFVFNSIFCGTSDSLIYKISEISKNKTYQNYAALASSGDMEYNMPSVKNLPGRVFWLLLLGCGMFVYQLIKYSSGKIYGLNIPEIDDFRKVNRNLILRENSKRLFVQGIPGSGKIEYLRSVLNGNGNFIFNKENNDKENNDKKNNVCILDLIRIPDESEFENEKEKKRGSQDKEKRKESEIEKWDRIVDELYDDKNIDCIIFNHFEYKILDEHTNRIKFNLIEKFMLAERERKIIISSNIDPFAFISSLKKYELASLVRKENGSAKKIEGGSSVNLGAGQYENAVGYENIHRWLNMLGVFTNLYADPGAVKDNEEDKKYMSGEYWHNINLIRIGKDFKDYPLDEDSILKLQSYSEHSYRYIWSSLTHEEQLALYDLAEDGLMNTTNYVSLTMLLNKGLIRKTDGKFTIMSRNFRNFVLTDVTSKEIKNIEKEISDGQTWNDYKYPVLIILGALLWFVLSSNPEKFGNVLPLVSGIMAGIPTILKLLSYFKPSDSKN